MPFLDARGVKIPLVSVISRFVVCNTNDSYFVIYTTYMSN